MRGTYFILILNPLRIRLDMFKLKAVSSGSRRYGYAETAFDPKDR